VKQRLRREHIPRSRLRAAAAVMSRRATTISPGRQGPSITKMPLCRSKGQMHMLRMLGFPSLQCTTGRAVTAAGGRSHGEGLLYHTASAALHGLRQRYIVTAHLSPERWWTLRTGFLGNVLIMYLREAQAMIRVAGVDDPGNLVAVAAFGGLLTSTLVPFYNHGNLPAVFFCCTTRHLLRAPTRLLASPHNRHPSHLLPDAATSPSPPI
jgi:hypothetical protein